MKRKKQFTILVILLISGLLLIDRDFRKTMNTNHETLSNEFPSTNNAVPIWNVSYSDVSAARKEALDSQGNVYAFGEKRFGYNSDLILVKYDSNGTQVWNRTWGYPMLEQVGGVAVGTDDSIYIASFSEFLQKAVLIKYDSQGNQLWNATYQTSGVYGTVFDVVADSENNAYVVGIPDNMLEIFLLKYNSSGILLNQTLIQAPTLMGNSRWSLFMDESDFLYLTGGPWKTYNGFFLAKYTSQCVQVWNKSLCLLLDGGTNQPPVTDICVDSSNNIYITGFYEDTGQTVLMKYDSVGSSIWNATHDKMMAYSVSLDDKGDPHIGGYSWFEYPMPFYKWHGIIAKFSSDGEFQWNHTFIKNQQHTFFYDIAFDESNNIYSLGEFGGSGLYYIIVVKFAIDETSPGTTLTKVPSSTIHYSDFNFTWTGTDDSTPTEQLVFSYYLEGNESDWSPWTSLTWAQYEFLANGTYTFHVRSKDTGGNIDPTPATVTFTVATPNWRRYAHIGSILLHRTCGVLMPILDWTHAGLYIGEGNVVEARAYWDGGVSIYDITDWDKTNRNALLLNVTTATQETKIKAAAWALFQAERTDYPFGEYAISGKRAAVDSKFWYCSELVWASYFNYGINLDNNVDLFDLVTPDDLHNNLQTTMIGSHWEDLWCGDSMLIYVRVLCPVNLRITDPEGLVISKSSTDIDGACYIEMDINDDGEQDDILGLPLLNYGKYTAEILLEPDALPTDTFSLIVTFGDKELTIVEDMLISDLPEEPFVFYVYENGIFLTPQNGEPSGIRGYDIILMILAILSLIGCVYYIQKRKIS